MWSIGIVKQRASVYSPSKSILYWGFWHHDSTGRMLECLTIKSWNFMWTASNNDSIATELIIQSLSLVRTWISQRCTCILVCALIICWVMLTVSILLSSGSTVERASSCICIQLCCWHFVYCRPRLLLLPYWLPVVMIIHKWLAI